MKTVEQDSRWKIDEETGIRWYEESGVIVAEMDIGFDDYGVGLIHEGDAYIFLRKGITEQQAEAVKANLLAKLYLGFAGPWERGGIGDRRNVPLERQNAAVKAFTQEYLRKEGA